jgi:hypothetical protein
MGLYSSFRDYLTLRHVLQIQGTPIQFAYLPLSGAVLSGAEIRNQPAGRPVLNPILKADTVNSFFVPTLTEEGAKSAISTTKLPTISHSTALGVTTEDWLGKRRKGGAFVCFKHVDLPYAY